MKLSAILLIVFSLCALGCGGSSAQNANGEAKDYRKRLEQIRLKRKAANDLSMLQNAVRTFQTQHARLPNDLRELATRKLIQNIPSAPAGFYFAYDNVLGNVSLQRIPADAIQREQQAVQNQPL
ncbi:MAG: hypothetical protein KJ626_02435 [Verrucomicrobia bacterium]|nr:hypothetical protein [Verrucomicrobiota bacterium]